MNESRGSADGLDQASTDCSVDVGAFRRQPTITDGAVDTALNAARTAAISAGAAVTVVIVDHSTEFRAVHRGDGADILTIGLAAGKARLAAANGVPTRRWRDIIGADPYLGLTLPIALDRLVGGAVLFGGGYPIRIEGHLVGAIGVSGGTEDQDDAVAYAGLATVPGAEPFDDDDAADGA